MTGKRMALIVKQELLAFEHRAGLGGDTKVANHMLEQCKNETEKSGDFKNISLIKTGCVITSHFGDNCIILCWKERD